MSGKTKWFSPQKGYGFITGEDGNDYFVHYSGIVSEGFKTLAQDQSVTFEINEGQNGRPQAVNVQPV